METPNPQNTKPPNPREISELQKAVNEASLRAAALWVSFMTFAAYLIVAVGSVDHPKLFQEAAIKLPILAAELPLVAFFAIAPFFLLLFHFYLFLNLVALSRRISTYNRVLTEDVNGEENQNLLRARLDTFPVVQLLSRPRRERRSLHTLLLNLVVWITLVGMPIVLLLQFQLTFLPYHDSVVTWMHRFLIGADIVLIWFFWFAIYLRGELHYPTPHRHPIALGFSVVVIFISIVVVSYPGERLAKLVSVPIPMLCWEKSAPISDCFLHGPVNMVTGRPRSPFFNVLVLPGQTLTDVKKAEAGQLTRSFRGRDLAGAILIGADIRFMDFTGTNLDEARLDRANASGSVFGCDDTGDSVLTSPSWPNHGCASLRGASLYGANLSGASFMNARMEGSVLLDANLSGARLLNAHLEYTVLTNANLTAAYLGSTRLHNAYMYQTNLSAAMLDQSEWGGALLEQCKFEFASVGRSRITEVGDTVGQPVLAFATFDLGGSAVPYANNASQFDEMRTRMLKRLLEEELRRNPWLKQYSLPDRVNPLIAVFTPDFYKSFYRKEAETNWGLLKVKAKDQWNFMNISVKKSNSKDVEGSKRRFLAERFAELACDGENAPFVARGLISNDIFSRVGASADIFLAKVRDISNCRGAAGLTAQEHAAVEARVASAKKSNAMRPESYPLPPAITAASAKMKSGKR